MHHVREVALRGTVLTICYPTTTDGRGWSGNGICKNNMEYTFDKKEDANQEFEKIQSFLEKESQKQKLS